MEGRWAVLATRAQRTGALDFAKLTGRGVDRVKEHLILNDIEREIGGELHKTLMQFCLALESRNKHDMACDCRDRYMHAMVPWEVKAPNEQDAKMKADELADFYKKIMEQGGADGDGPKTTPD